MAQLGTESSQLCVAKAGNTKSRLRMRSYMLTINNFNKNDELNIKNIESSKYIYQIEKGESGTEHIQLWIYFENPIEWKTVKSWFPTAHIEKAKSNRHSIEYCSKKETRVRGPYYKNVEIEEEIETISEFKPWQTDLLKKLDEKPDHRKIIWYFDKEGGKGKTDICKWLCVNRDDCLYTGGKANDMKYAITQMKKKPKIILIDISRSQETCFSYQGVEEIKNGIFFCGKYESQQFIMNRPHVICFANFEPDKKKLSLDRWDIINMEDL